jgi:hypothetical protein
MQHCRGRSKRAIPNWQKKLQDEQEQTGKPHGKQCMNANWAPKSTTKKNNGTQTTRQAS